MFAITQSTGIISFLFAVLLLTIMPYIINLAGLNMIDAAPVLIALEIVFTLTLVKRKLNFLLLAVVVALYLSPSVWKHFGISEIIYSFEYTEIGLIILICLLMAPKIVKYKGVIHAEAAR